MRLRTGPTPDWIVGAFTGRSNVASPGIPGLVDDRIKRTRRGSITQPTFRQSPYVYQNTSEANESLIVAGGTVTKIEVSRDGVTWYTVGLLAGQFLLPPGDRLRVTYTLAPTITVLPI